MTDRLNDRIPADDHQPRALEPGLTLGRSIYARFVVHPGITGSAGLFGAGLSAASFGMERSAFSTPIQRRHVGRSAFPQSWTSMQYLLANRRSGGRTKSATITNSSSSGAARIAVASDNKTPPAREEYSAAPAAPGVTPFHEGSTAMGSSDENPGPSEIATQTSSVSPESSSGSPAVSLSAQSDGPNLATPSPGQQGHAIAFAAESHSGSFPEQTVRDTVHHRFAESDLSPNRSPSPAEAVMSSYPVTHSPILLRVHADQAPVVHRQELLPMDATPPPPTSFAERTPATHAPAERAEATLFQAFAPIDSAMQETNSYSAKTMPQSSSQASAKVNRLTPAAVSSSLRSIEGMQEQVQVPSHTESTRTPSQGIPEVRPVETAGTLSPLRAGRSQEPGGNRSPAVSVSVSKRFEQSIDAPGAGLQRKAAPDTTIGRRPQTVPGTSASGAAISHEPPPQPQIHPKLDLPANPPGPARAHQLSRSGGGIELDGAPRSAGPAASAPNPATPGGPTGTSLADLHRAGDPFVHATFERPILGRNPVRTISTYVEGQGTGQGMAAPPVKDLSARSTSLRAEAGSSIARAELLGRQQLPQAEAASAQVLTSRANGAIQSSYDVANAISPLFGDAGSRSSSTVSREHLQGWAPPPSSAPLDPSPTHDFPESGQGQNDRLSNDRLQSGTRAAESEIAPPVSRTSPYGPNVAGSRVAPLPYDVPGRMVLQASWKQPEVERTTVPAASAILATVPTGPLTGTEGKLSPALTHRIAPSLAGGGPAYQPLASDLAVARRISMAGSFIAPIAQTAMGQRAMASMGQPAIGQTAQPPGLSDLRATSLSSTRAQSAAEINQLANRVYELLVKRLASERQRRGN